ncbi:hypothetical protein M569_00965, partial [Genlisea aurea]
LLELAAVDDLAGFRREVREMGRDLNEVGLWYGRNFGSNKMGFEERTPLMMAAMYGSTSVLKYIVDSGAVDVNGACGSDGVTALHCAAAGGSRASSEIVRILIDADADVNAVAVNGKKAGDLIPPPPCAKSCNSFERKSLEVLLNGRATKYGNEKREYSIEIPMPDINDGIYGSDEFRMYSFKVRPCSRAYSHDWTECPFVHPGENARRRDLRKYNYTCVPCPEFKKGNCGKGDNCEFAHGVFESWLHPAQYRTRLCKDETGCGRKVCFFAHRPEELRPVYAATGSALASPKSVELSGLGLSPLSIGSPTVMGSSSSSSSPIVGGGLWPPTKAVVPTPPSLQLPGSRLKAAVSARDVDDVFASYDSQLLSQLQSLQSPTAGIHLRQNMNPLRASYPSNVSPSPSRMYGGFDTSAAVAAAVLNSRSSSGFAKRSQSFVDRGRPGNSPGPMASKLAEWSSPDGRLNWEFNGDDVNKLRKSASFGIRNGISPPEPDVSWVNS